MSFILILILKLYIKNEIDKIDEGYNQGIIQFTQFILNN